MDPQLQNLLIAVVIGFVAYLVIRYFFKALGMIINLVILVIIVVIAYLVLTGGA